MPVAVDPYVNALLKIGFFTALGKLVDFLLYREEDDRLRLKLESWRYRFAYMNWQTLGRVEAEAAMAVWDKLVGKHFWSWQRLLAAMAVAVAADVLAGRPPVTQWSDAGEKIFVYKPIALIGVNTVIVALSFSLTRYLNSIVVALPDRKLTRGFVALLAINVFLLVVWRPIVDGLDIAFYFIEAMVAKGAAASNSVELLTSPEFWALLANVLVTILRTHIAMIGSLDTVMTSGGITNIATNWIRLIFSFAFVFSLAGGYLAREVLLRLLTRLHDNKTPVFTTLGCVLSILLQVPFLPIW